MTIIKGHTACYECFPKPTQKVYPICTIRSTPDKPIHCIVWAKELFKLLFGNKQESMLYEDASAGDKSAYMDYIEFPKIDDNNNNNDNNNINNYVDTILNYGVNLLTALYDFEIQKRIEMNVYKTASVLPFSLSSTDIASARIETKRFINSLTPSTSTIATTETNIKKEDEAIFIPASLRTGWQQKVLSVNDILTDFLYDLYVLSGSEDAKLIGILNFDKDDLWTMKFVTNASNLRSFVFSIPMLSFHDVKGIAGNIIPAIATTNAIVAAMQVIQAINIIIHRNNNNNNKNGEEITTTTTTNDETKTSLLFQQDKAITSICPHTYVLRLPTRRGHFLDPTKPDAPVENCYVCGTVQLNLQVFYSYIITFIFK
jgi:ubiquitin-like 1-activating enzyme E1 B